MAISAHPHEAQREGRDVAVVDSRTPPVIAPGHNFESVTDAKGNMNSRLASGWSQRSQ